MRPRRRKRGARRGLEARSTPRTIGAAKITLTYVSPKEQKGNVYNSSLAQIDDITRSFKEYDLLRANENASLDNRSAAANVASTAKALLCVHHKNLNAAFEMKRMFGSKVVQMKQ